MQLWMSEKWIHDVIAELQMVCRRLSPRYTGFFEKYILR